MNNEETAQATADIQNLTDWGDLDNVDISDIDSAIYGEVDEGERDRLKVYIGRTLIPVKVEGESTEDSFAGNVVEKYHAIIVPYMDSLMLSNVRVDDMTPDDIKNGTIPYPLIIASRKVIERKAALARAGDERYNGYIFIADGWTMIEAKLQDYLDSIGFTREEAMKTVKANEEAMEKLEAEARKDAEANGIKFEDYFA